MLAVKQGELRRRGHFLLWQEIAAAAAAEVRQLLAEKYGFRV
jgi:hypothetical protein